MSAHITADLYGSHDRNGFSGRCEGFTEGHSDDDCPNRPTWATTVWVESCALRVAGGYLCDEHARMAGLG